MRSYSLRKNPVYLGMVLLGLALLGTIVLPKDGFGQGVPVKMGDVLAYVEQTGYLITYFSLFDDIGVSISASGKVDYIISIRDRKTKSAVLSCSLATRLVNPEDFITPIIAYTKTTRKPIVDCKKVYVYLFPTQSKVYLPDGKGIALMGLLAMKTDEKDVWAIIRFSPLNGKAITGEGRVGWDFGRDR